MKSSSTVVTPSSPTRSNSGYLHLGLTALLLIAVTAIAGLALTGRIRFAPVPQTSKAESETKEANEKEPNKPSSKYQIEKVDDFQNLLHSAGRSGFFGDILLDTWVFKYTGGLIECRLQTDLDDEAAITLPDAEGLKRLLQREEARHKDTAALPGRTGFIILTAPPSSVSFNEAMAPYQVHLGALMAFASYGPLHALAPLHLEVHNTRPYRMLVSISTPASVDGPGMHFSTEGLLKIRSPFIPRDPGLEEFHARGSKDLQPGKEAIILDRQRGFTRLRLKARFLADGEVRALLPK